MIVSIVLQLRPNSDVEFSTRKTSVIAHELARAATHMMITPRVFDLIASYGVDTIDNDMR